MDREWILQDGWTDSSVRELAMGTKTTLPDRRLFIDDRLHKCADFVAEATARTWLAAKHQFAARQQLLEI